MQVSRDISRQRHNSTVTVAWDSVITFKW